MQIKEITRPCPICNSSDSVLFFDRQKRGVFIEYDDKAYHEKHVFCKECGLIYLNPVLDQESLIYFYKEKYRKLYYHNVQEIEILHAKMRQEFLLKRFSNLINLKVLDVGSSTGIFPYLMNSFCDVIDSIEPNKDHCAFASEVYGTTHCNTTIEAFTAADKYDLITMFDAFEHVFAPDVVLNKIKDLLAPGGHFYIELPSVHYPRIGALGFFSSAHTFSFSENTIALLFKKYGFDIVHLDHNGHKRDMRILAQYTGDYITEYKRMDSIQDIVDTWKQFDTLQVAMNSVVSYKLNPEEIKSKMEVVGAENPKFNSMASSFVALAGADFGDAEKIDMVVPYVQEALENWTSDDGSLNEPFLYCVMAVSNYFKGELFSAYRYACRGLEHVPRLWEIDIPKEIDTQKLMKIYASTFYVSNLLHIKKWFYENRGLNYMANKVEKQIMLIRKWLKK